MRTTTWRPLIGRKYGIVRRRAPGPWPREIQRLEAPLRQRRQALGRSGVDLRQQGSAAGGRCRAVAQETRRETMRFLLMSASRALENRASILRRDPTQSAEIAPLGRPCHRVPPELVLLTPVRCTNPTEPRVSMKKTRESCAFRHWLAPSVMCSRRLHVVVVGTRALRRRLRPTTRRDRRHGAHPTNSGFATAVPVTAVTLEDLMNMQPGRTIAEQLDQLPQFTRRERATRRRRVVR